MFIIHARPVLVGRESLRGRGKLLFGVLRPVECGAYSSGVSEKQKNESFLCGRAVALAEAGVCGNLLIQTHRSSECNQLKVY